MYVVLVFFFGVKILITQFKFIHIFFVYIKETEHKVKPLDDDKKCHRRIEMGSLSLFLASLSVVPHLKNLRSVLAISYSF